jgi:hypothetical protein
VQEVQLPTIPQFRLEEQARTTPDTLSSSSVNDNHFQQCSYQYSYYQTSEKKARKLLS